MLARAIADARELEKNESWIEAITAYTKIAQDFPESEAGKTYLESVCNTLRARPHGFAPEVFAPMREAVTEAAQLGVVSAMMVLAENLRKPAPGESFQWFSRAGEAGDPEGLTQAGLMAANGDGTPRSFEKAVEFFQKAAEKGHPSAQAALGECLLRGKGIAKDEAAAVALLQKSVSGGNIKAMVLLSDCYKEGLGGLSKSPKESVRLLEVPVQNEDAPAMAILGVDYMTGYGVEKDERRGFDLFKRAAAKGDEGSMYNVAICYQGGVGTSKNLQLMREWFQKAAEAGHPKAAEWCRANKVDFTPKASGSN
jgi:TPR repeat protein